MRTVMMKKTTPSTAMANKFLPTMSHSRGDRNLFSPGGPQDQHENYNHKKIDTI